MSGSDSMSPYPKPTFTSETSEGLKMCRKFVWMPSAFVVFGPGNCPLFPPGCTPLTSGSAPGVNVSTLL